MLYYGEMRRLLVAENIVFAYRSKKAAETKPGGWGKWAEEHPQLDQLLSEVEILASEIE